LKPAPARPPMMRSMARKISQIKKTGVRTGRQKFISD
jgi:hypothetical protein